MPEPEARPWISVVIPSYNSATWLGDAVASANRALSRIAKASEIIVVNDGSTDDTQDVLDSIQKQLTVPLRVLHQENRGRFAARWEGALAARSDFLLLLDSRMLLDEAAIAYALGVMDADSQVQAWNCHVTTDTASPLVGHFWSVPTHLFWSEYLARPRPMLITPENFDRVPKGTGGLLIRKGLFVEACHASWPSGDARLVSDDTKILRFIVEQAHLRLDPDYSAIYRPRTTVRQFLSHAWGRGTLFVDSYAGTSHLRNALLIAFALLPPIVIVVLGLLFAWGQWTAALGVIGVALLVILAPALVASRRRAPAVAVLSYVVFVWPFAAYFWAGLLRGTWVHRRAFKLLKKSPNAA